MNKIRQTINPSNNYSFITIILFSALGQIIKYTFSQDKDKKIFCLSGELDKCRQEVSALNLSVSKYDENKRSCRYL